MGKWDHSMMSYLQYPIDTINSVTFHEILYLSEDRASCHRLPCNDAPHYNANYDPPSSFRRVTQHVKAGYYQGYQIDVPYFRRPPRNQHALSIQYDSQGAYHLPTSQHPTTPSTAPF